MARQDFEALIRSDPRGGSWVDVPFDVQAVFGTHGRVPIQATIDGEAYRGSLVPMGDAIGWGCSRRSARRSASGPATACA